MDPLSKEGFECNHDCRSQPAICFKLVKFGSPTRTSFELVDPGRLQPRGSAP